MKNIFIFAFIGSVTLFSCDSITMSKLFPKEIVNPDAVEKPKKDPNATRKTFYDNGQVRAEVPYKDGKKHGVANNYYENGNVKLSIPYTNGLRNGVSKYNYEDGKLYRETPYLNDKIHGLRKVYASGKLQAEIPYHLGIPCTGLKEYYLSGKQKTDFPYISVNTRDDRLKSGVYYVMVKFSKTHPEDEFWLGNLNQNGCIENILSLQQIPTEKGIGTLEMSIPAGAYVMQKLSIIGKHKTKQGNPYVTTRDYNLVIE